MWLDPGLNLIPFQVPRLYLAVGSDCGGCGALRLPVQFLLSAFPSSVKKRMLQVLGEAGGDVEGGDTLLITAGLAPASQGSESRG